MNQEKKNKNKNLILITGGHATPAIACIDELRLRGYENLIYIGQKKSLLFDKNPSSEFRLITEQVQIPFKSIIAGKVSLFPNFHSLIWFLRLPIGFIQALFWILFYKPKLILTFGSHVGVPVVFWGWVFRIPIIAHEQTTTIGRSNKFIQKFARKVCLSWLEMMHDGEKFVLTGNPVRKEILNSPQADFDFSDKSKKLLLITGGNQGSHAINEFIFGYLPKLILKYNVLHQTGSNTLFNDYAKARELEEKINKSSKCYLAKDYIFSEEMSVALNNASIIISRAGANSVTEFLVLKKKALFIPIATSSGNEQFLNARLLEKLRLAKSINQADLPIINLIELLESIESLEPDFDEIEKISELHKNAQKKIIDIVEEVLKR